MLNLKIYDKLIEENEKKKKEDRMFKKLKERMNELTQIIDFGPEDRI